MKKQPRKLGHSLKKYFTFIFASPQFNSKCFVWIGVWKGCVRVKVWGFEKKVWRKLSVFGLGYVRLDVWRKFIEIYDWCDDYKNILNYVNYKITNLFLYIKKYKK